MAEIGIAGDGLSGAVIGRRARRRFRASWPRLTAAPGSACSPGRAIACAMIHGPSPSCWAGWTGSATSPPPDHASALRVPAVGGLDDLGEPLVSPPSEHGSAWVGSAYVATGSPARRPTTSCGTGRPATASVALITSSTDDPMPVPRLTANGRPSVGPTRVGRAPGCGRRRDPRRGCSRGCTSRRASGSRRRTR